MKGRSTVFALSILLVLMVGCTSRPVFTVEVYKTPSPIAAADQASAMPDLVTAVPIVPTNSPIPQPVSGMPTPAAVSMMPTEFSPVLYGRKYDANTFFTLLGAVQGTDWLAPEQAAAQFGGEWNYDVYTFASGGFQVQGHAPEFSPTARSYFIGTNEARDDFGMVAVLRGWPVRQGAVSELSASIDVYQDVVMEWLAAQGLQSPVLGDMHIFRVDLEADGVDEIFISATRLDGSQHTVRTGDYSILLLRKVNGNEVTTIPVVADIYYSSGTESTFPQAYSYANFIDLNRDGVLEVVVDVERWEGDGALLFEVDGQKVRQVP